MSSKRKRAIHWDFFSLVDNNKRVKYDLYHQELAYHSLTTATYDEAFKMPPRGRFVSQCHETSTRQCLFSSSNITFFN